MSDHTVVTHQQPRQSEPWKWIAITLGAVIAAVLVFGIVTAYLPDDAREDDAKTKAAAEPAPVRERVVVVPSEPARPASADIGYCNQVASGARSRNEEMIRNGIIGGAIGAGVGAASGAIANGGKGAGKGAGIGAIVGATAGTLYGLNKSNQNNANAEYAYRSCMAQRGF